MVILSLQDEDIVKSTLEHRGGRGSGTVLAHLQSADGAATLGTTSLSTDAGRKLWERLVLCP